MRTEGQGRRATLVGDQVGRVRWPKRDTLAINNSAQVPPMTISHAIPSEVLAADLRLNPGHRPLIHEWQPYLVINPFIVCAALRRGRGQRATRLDLHEPADRLQIGLPNCQIVRLHQGLCPFSDPGDKPVRIALEQPRQNHRYFTGI